MHYAECMECRSIFADAEGPMDMKLDFAKLFREHQVECPDATEYEVARW